MRLGFGAGSGEIHILLQEAGRRVLAVTEAVEQRFLQWPSGPSQDDVKELEHDADRAVSELLRQTNTLFVTPYDRDDLVTLAFAIDDVADCAENAAELLGLYGVETPTKQSFELCALLPRHMRAGHRRGVVLAPRRGGPGSDMAAQRTATSVSGGNQ